MRTTLPQRLGLLVALAVVAGLLVAGLALPLVGGVGFAASKTDSALDKLPTYLKQKPLAQRSVIYAADGKTVLAIISGSEDRVVVPASAIPAVVKKTIVAIEDNRFYEHNGVDLRGVLRAAKADSSSGQYDQGASTITEQYVKLVQLEQAGEDKSAQQAATAKSLSRKIEDARLAIALEKTTTKDTILTNYLNIAYFGEGVYGIGTAAEHYFGLSVTRLSLAQAALLAGLVNNPTGFDPVAHPQASLTRRDQVLDAVGRYGFLPAVQVAAAKKSKLVVHPEQHQNKPCATSIAPTYCTYVVQQLINDPKVGRTALLTGGLRVVTPFVPSVQRSVDTNLRRHVPAGQRQVAVGVVEQPGTGNLAAIGQTRDYNSKEGEFVLPDDPINEVGSTFKLMTLTAALEQGLPLTTSYNSPPCYRPPTSWRFDPPSSPSCTLGFRNAGDSEGGTYDLVSGTWKSVNTFFIQLEHRVGGPAAVAAEGKKLGITGSSRKLYPNRNFQDGAYGASITLGSANGVDAIDMTNAYATIDAHGVRCSPTAVTKVTGPTGRNISFTHSPCQQVVSADVADEVTSILQGVITRGTAHGLSIDRPSAGKTGTVNDSNEAWFVGYIPQFVTTVGVFDPSKPSSPVTPICDPVLRCWTRPGTLFGADISGHAWRDIMTDIADGLPVQEFAKPATADPGARLPKSPPPAKTAVPTVSNLSVQAASKLLQSQKFVVQVQSTKVPSMLPRDTVVGTNPPAGTPAPTGSSVVLILSSGMPPSAATTPPPKKHKK